MKRERLAVLLMIVSVLPMTAFAEESDGGMVTSGPSAEETGEKPEGEPVTTPGGEPVTTPEDETTKTPGETEENGENAGEELEEDTCQHERTGWVFTSHGHSCICLDCFEFLVTEEEQTMQGSTCTVCGYRCCEDGHTFGTEGVSKHVCLKCNYISDCVDEEGDSVCDICGLQMNSKPTEPEPTEPKPTEPSGQKGLDNVLKTSDLSVAVAGLAALVFGTTATVLKKVRR